MDAPGFRGTDAATSAAASAGSASLAHIHGKSLVHCLFGRPCHGDANCQGSRRSDCRRLRHAGRGHRGDRCRSDDRHRPAKNRPGISPGDLPAAAPCLNSERDWSYSVTSARLGRQNLRRKAPHGLNGRNTMHGKWRNPISAARTSASGAHPPRLHWNRARLNGGGPGRVGGEGFGLGGELSGARYFPRRGSGQRYFHWPDHAANGTVRFFRTGYAEGL